jgi:purine-binding chemotaxis protein CheW
VQEAHDIRPGKYLTFPLGAEEYGIRVLQVREIIGVQDITSVPQTPAYVKGVINLRGKVIPVVDLRLKFNMPAVETTSHTCIIVVQVRAPAGPALVGLLVDGVCEVVTLAAPDIEDTPDFAGSLPAPFLLGLAKTRGKVRILLEIDAVLSSTDLNDVGSILRENA